MKGRRDEQSPRPDGPVPRFVALQIGSPLIARRPVSACSAPRPASLKPSPTPPPETTMKTSWNIEDEKVPFVPPHFPLERTHVTVAGVGGSDVARRIVEGLRDASIAAVYSDEKAMATAETADNVRFDVRLFQAPTDGVVVEMQKRSGSCFGFHDAVRSVLPAAQGLSLDSKPAAKRVPMVDSEEGPNEERLEEALGLAANLLAKDRLDANMLGMESLVHLSRTTADASKAYVARKILNSQDGVTDVLLSCVESKRDDDDEEEEDKMDEEHYGMMLRHSLSVFGNTMSTLDSEGDLKDVIDSNSWIEEDLMKNLIKELSNAEQKPHDAYEGARCLNAMFRSAPRLKSKAKPLGLKQAIVTALNEGLLRHALLASETEELMKLLDTIETEDN